MKAERTPDILHFPWTCPLCHWQGEMTLETHFGNDQGRHLHLGDCLFACGQKVEPRHLYFLESFTCPGCACEDESFFFVAELHCRGNRWWGVETYPTGEIFSAKRVA